MNTRSFSARAFAGGLYDLAEPLKKRVPNDGREKRQIENSIEKMNLSKEMKLRKSMSLLRMLRSSPMRIPQSRIVRQIVVSRYFIPRAHVEFYLP